MKYERDVLDLADYYLINEIKGDEFTTKELSEYIIEKGLISKAPFYLKLDKRGSRLNSILEKSGKFKGEIKYSTTYKRYLKYWKRC